MADDDDAFLDRLRATFAVEAVEHLTAMSSGLVALERATDGGQRQALVEGIFRDAHNLKGAARVVNRADIEALCQRLESVFAAMKRGALAPTSAVFDRLHRSVDGLEQLLPTPVADAHGERALDGVIADLELLLAGDTEVATGSSASQQDAAAPGEPAVTTASGSAATVRIAADKLDLIYRQAEELIGAKLAAEERGREMREVRAALRGCTKAAADLRQVLPPRAAGARDYRDAFARHDGALRALAEQLESVASAAEVDRRTFAKMLDNLLDEAKALLKQPIASGLRALPRVVRELGREQGKDIDVAIDDGGIEIDRRILDELKDPLVHLVRNSVDHGLETPAERARAGKPARGAITIHAAYRDAGKVELTIADDGRGINRAAVLDAARRSGLVSADETPPAAEIAALILRSGVSTSDQVSAISGRGLGLAIVSDKVERLGGTLSVASEPALGTSFKLVLPVTLASFRGVTVRVAERLFVVPTANVTRVARVSMERVTSVENRSTVQLGGRQLALVHLGEVLGIGSRRDLGHSPQHCLVAVLAAAGQAIAFAVDEVLGEQEVLLKDLGSQFVRVRNLAGSTQLGTGGPVPLLNVPDLLRTAVAIAASQPASPAPPLRDLRAHRILLVDDSITARTLLSNILQAAGYVVHTAVDGSDAWASLATSNFDLVVSDVEMPRMDGFELTTRIRGDARLCELPVVLVTALASREHRERGVEVGANAYLIKSEFDQAALLECIRRVI